MNDAGSVTTMRPDDQAKVVIEFLGLSDLVALFSGGVNMLNVLRMSTVVGGLPGMLDDHGQLTVQVFMEFLNAELARAWCRHRLVLGAWIPGISGH